MRKDLEVAIVRALGKSVEQHELYWIFSRTQLEFVLKELDQVDDSENRTLARYQDMSLPVVFLENYFGYVQESDKESSKYMVLCGADTSQNLRKLIVASEDSPKFFKLTRSFTTLDTFSIPENSEHVLGVYSLGRNKVGVVPDVAGISNKLV